MITQDLSRRACRYSRNRRSPTVGRRTCRWSTRAPRPNRVAPVHRLTTRGAKPSTTHASGGPLSARTPACRREEVSARTARQHPGTDRLEQHLRRRSQGDVIRPSWASSGSKPDVERRSPRDGRSVAGARADPIPAIFFQTDQRGVKLRIMILESAANTQHGGGRHGVSDGLGNIRKPPRGLKFPIC